MRGYTKSHYLTVRCQACESWLHPKAMAAHAQPGRCKGRPWDEELDDTRLVTGDTAELFARVLTPGLVGRPTFSEDRVLSPGVGERLRDEVYQGIVVRSPLVSVDSSRWVVVATAAALASGESGVREALTAEGFASLERELLLDVVRCGDCGEWVRPRGLAIHRAKSALCRWRRAVAEVREVWVVGFRDPWSVPEAPLDWAGLNGSAAWRRRVHVVTFSRWAAVLLAPPDDAGERGNRLANDPRKQWRRP